MYLLAIKINSIQDYIFQSNLLKENIGASHITNSVIFNTVLKNTLKTFFPGPNELDWDSWKTNPGKLAILGTTCQCEVVEIGGGGIFIILNADPKPIITAFSKEQMQQFPGLKVSCAFVSDFDPAEFKMQRIQLLKELEYLNKSGYHVTVPYKPGFTEGCSHSQYAVEFLFYKGDDEIRNISAFSLAKIEQAEKADLEYEKVISDKENFTFTNKIDQLGQDPEAGYIAVVHIDGNAVGQRVERLETIQELREFSRDRAGLVQNALDRMINVELANRTDKESGKLGEIQLQKDPVSNRWILPIRPLLNGGDDMTFVCEGRLGVFLAEVFLRNFILNKQVIAHACAGVAIVKTKFPFYKAYQLSEELCAEAKKRSRENEGQSYISFFCSSTTFAGTLPEIRKRTHHTDFAKDLYFGPYSITKTGDDTLQELKCRILHFQNESRIPRNKVMKLREVLSRSFTEQKLFIKELKERGHQLPSVASRQNSDSLFYGNVTPFFDPIDLMEFYPKELLV